MNIKRLCCLFLAGALCLSAWGCASTAEETTLKDPQNILKTVNYMEHIEPAPAPAEGEGNSRAAAEFAVELLRNSYGGGNCVLAPGSVYTVLAMLANGAAGETRTQMEALLGGSTEEINGRARRTAPGKELASASSLWLKNQENFEVREDFLQTNGKYYGAEIFGVPFCEETRQEINGWVSRHTGGRIPEILDSMDPAAAMYLVNALAFDAAWEKPYTEQQVSEGIFRGTAGEEKVPMMKSREVWYLEDSGADGFLKDYENGRYCYMALLPEEGTTMEAYLKSLTGERLLETVRNAQQVPVKVTMPKYKTETSLELSEILGNMGMKLAFSMDADFSGISDTELRISRMLHRTELSVDELGTEAGAASAAEAAFKCVLLHDITVTLDRPFVMGIFDREQETFLFLGVIESVR